MAQATSHVSIVEQTRAALEISGIENADGSRMSTPRAESHDHSDAPVRRNPVKAWTYSGPDDMGPRFPRGDEIENSDHSALHRLSVVRTRSRKQHHEIDA